MPVARGRTSQEMETELNITSSTVKAHLASVMRRLGAPHPREVAMWAYETGRI